jgi:hypothetical protein
MAVLTAQFKVGVPHVEAPEWLLEKMLTMRLHLDDMTEENGPLKVLPGSHHSGKAMISGKRGPASAAVSTGTGTGWLEAFRPGLGITLLLVGAVLDDQLAFL